MLCLAATCLLCQALGVHFYTLPGQQMCFHQHIAAEVAVAVKYTKITQLMMKGASDVDMELQYAQATREAKRRESQRSRSSAHSQERNSLVEKPFSPKLGGEYDICTMCLEEVGRRWKAQLSSKAKTKWSLTVDALDEAELGDLPFGPEDAATGGDFKTTASKMKSLIGRVTGMVSENEYERDQEEIFRNASETVNGRVMWAAILQIIIYAAIAAYQVWSSRWSSRGYDDYGKKHYHDTQSSASYSSTSGGSSVSSDHPPAKSKDDDIVHFEWKRGDRLGEQGRYICMKHLGDGTFGRVIGCADTYYNNQMVAVKVIRDVQRYKESS
ncbi:hypothetical protein FOZ60_005445 [Perkinsus olseni]|uniref:GOLD domain-containing protein n=1 Tax=Perkinsus olseni TaxID=32597 RepID=A0A7J6NRB9_PEROL|nr:hypothetical protein FOZ60_005445 [Perkinsus olseni]